MKLKCIIEDYKNEKLVKSNYGYFNTIYKIKEKVLVLYAVLTNDDINKIPKEYINKKLLFRSYYNLIFEGEVMVLTECRVRKLPYIIKNDEFFKTNPELENRIVTPIIDLLQEIERSRCRKEKENNSDLLDYIVRYCQAVIARAIGYKSRADWSEIIQKELNEKKLNIYNFYFNKEKRNTPTEDDYYNLETPTNNIVNLMDILYELEVFRNKFQFEKITGNESIKICEAIIAHAKGYKSREDWLSEIKEKELYYKTRGMKELFQFNWDIGNRCANDYIIEWLEENGCNWYYNKFMRLEFYMNNKSMSCEYICNGLLTTVFYGPAN